jgi:hypothetical protein
VDIEEKELSDKQSRIRWETQNRIDIVLDIYTRFLDRLKVIPDENKTRNIVAAVLTNSFFSESIYDSLDSLRNDLHITDLVEKRNYR